MARSAPVVRALAVCTVVALCCTSGVSLRNDVSAYSAASSSPGSSHLLGSSLTTDHSVDQSGIVDCQDHDLHNEKNLFCAESHDTRRFTSRSVEYDDADSVASTVRGESNNTDLTAISQLNIVDSSVLDTDKRADREVLQSPSNADADEYSDESDPEEKERENAMEFKTALYNAVASELVLRRNIGTICLLSIVHARLFCVAFSIDPMSVDALSLEGICRLIVRCNQAFRQSVLMPAFKDAFRIYFVLLTILEWRSAILLLAYAAFDIWDDYYYSRILPMLVPLISMAYMLGYSEVVYLLDPLRYNGEVSSGPTNSQIAKALAIRLCAKDIEDPELTCVTCLHRLRRSQYAICKLSCGHIFHIRCIRSWLKKHEGGNCPICRADVFADPKRSN